MLVAIDGQSRRPMPCTPAYCRGERFQLLGPDFAAPIDSVLGLEYPKPSDDMGEDDFRPEALHTQH